MLDPLRNRLYITNSGYNRIEVFDTQQQRFLNPIPVGQMPHQMAMSSDGNTLYVGNTGGESISIVDLNAQQVVDSVGFPPIPRNGTVPLIYPRSLAMGLFGLQFLMSNGSQWEVVGNTAIPAGQLRYSGDLGGLPQLRNDCDAWRLFHSDAVRRRPRLRVQRTL